ncbi:Double C2-like domain-containing protein beta [Acropora cervicornis]|uniref:Double C2-like domain-containing protein beta n=1 Tax=Acropora cervicornis TaxID=6130 RepID=A0AAD9VH10_ACRCE|nr:Double C2-like domain-containing protein beta [Acropora cervicornis]
MVEEDTERNSETRCEDPRGSKASGMSEQIDEEQRWVCPNDRQLCLRAKLNSGWSFHTSGPTRKPASKNNISVSEQEIIRDVLERSERLRQIEEERIGRLVDKLENMHNSAIGDGRETCLLCNSKFGTLKVVAKRCDICEKNVCQKCGLDTHDSDGDPIWLCLLCSEHRELWKRTGAWFFKAIPNYRHPRQDQESTGKRKETKSSNSSDYLSLSWTHKYDQTWPSYSNAGDSVDGVVGVESESEEEESSSSSDEMIFDPRQKSALYSDMDQSAADDERPLYSSRLSDLSMPGSIILENSDTPPPFRKRTLPLTEQDKYRRPGGVSPRLALKEDVNGQTESPEKSYTRQKTSPFLGRASEEEVKVDVHRTLILKQETEEEDIDEVVRTYKESEAVGQSDTGNAGLGTIEFSVHYDKQHSQLQITIECAKSNKLRTHTKYKTLNPRYGETLVYHGITDDDLSKKSLRLQVLDEDKLGRNNFIGETFVPLKVFHSKPSQSLKRSLVSRLSEPLVSNLGRIQISLRYKSQKNQLKKTKRRTSIKKKTLNPEFNEEFIYEIPHHELAKKSLELTVWDKDVGKSNDFIGGITMGMQSSGGVLSHWYEMLRTPNEIHTRWHTLEKLANQEQE